MEELIKVEKLQFNKSTLCFNKYKNEKGFTYIKVIQNCEIDTENTILINPKNLDAIITVLKRFKEEISADEKNVSDLYISEMDQKIIIKTFLKGVQISDLVLQFRYEDATIREILLKNNIVIIDGIKNPPKNPSKYRWKKGNRY